MGETAARQIVLDYFEAVSAGDIDTIDSLLAEDVEFWVPPSLPDGITFRGKSQVMRLFTESVALYDAEAGMDIRLVTVTAEGQRVAVELTIDGRAAHDGRPYHNHYHFLFQVEDGRIRRIREHFDSLYAWRTLFEPVGMLTPADCPWLP
jgi:ketosteroid isomerase-like protein